MDKSHGPISTARRQEKHCFHFDVNFSAIRGTGNWKTPRATHQPTKREHLSKENGREILQLYNVDPYRTCVQFYRRLRKFSCTKITMQLIIFNFYALLRDYKQKPKTLLLIDLFRNYFPGLCTINYEPFIALIIRESHMKF